MLADQSAAQLTSARARLNLSPQQVPAWNVYEDSIRALLADLAREAPDAGPVGQAVAGGAVQRIDRRVDLARNRYTALESVADAMRALYAQLDEEQRVMADRVLAGTVPSLSAGGFGPAPDGSMPDRPRSSPGGGPPQRQGQDRRPM